MGLLSFFRSAPRDEPVHRTATSAYAVEVAYLEIGHGETTGQNAGADVDKYRRGASGPVIGRPGDPWCASFVCYCLELGWEKAWRTDVIASDSVTPPFPIKRTSNAKKLYERVGRYGYFPSEPRAGDVACWDRRGGGHVGLVCSVEEGAFHTVEANRGAYPSKVRKYLHELGEHMFIGFARFL